jgi:hypothetical protein
MDRRAATWEALMPSKRQDQAGRDRHRGHEPDGDGVADAAVLVSARRSMLSIAVSSARIALPRRCSIRPAVTALPARRIDSYSAWWKLPARSEGTSRPRSAEASCRPIRPDA